MELPLASLNEAECQYKLTVWCHVLLWTSPVLMNRGAHQLRRVINQIGRRHLARVVICRFTVRIELQRRDKVACRGEDL